MDGILVILSLIVKITIVGFFTSIIIHILSNLKRSNLKEDISKVEAKMSALRLNLKNKVKKKSLRFRGTYTQAIAKGEPIDVCLNKLNENPFEKNSDYQDYIDTCKKINEYIDLASLEKGGDSTQENKQMSLTFSGNFMGTDLKNELSIARTISDMVEVSKILSKLVHKYNHIEHRNKIQATESISFPSMFELQKVFKNSPINSEDESELQTSNLSNSTTALPVTGGANHYSNNSNKNVA